MTDYTADVNRVWLESQLWAGDVQVTFTKKDGSERKMLCTLSESFIPPAKMPKGAGKAKSKEAIAVFDVEKKEWRSFRLDSITNVETLPHFWT